jgi:hypothetical protein
MDVLSGVTDGSLAIGSRTPTAFPAWITLSVMRGGFATGCATGEHSLDLDERLLLKKFGLPLSRTALFSFFLADEGQEFAMQLLAERRYRVDLPEDAALLTLAWLRHHGHIEVASALAEQLAPYAGKLRFAPKVLSKPQASQDLVFRRSALQVKEKLSAGRAKPAIEAQREALGVWLPFTDRLVELWWRTRGVTPEDTRLAVYFPPDWQQDAEALLTEYEALAGAHPYCKKYRNPKESLQILLTATRDILSGDPNHPGDAKARYAMDCLVRAHGEPGSARLLALRAEQQRVVEAPSHARIAAVVAARLPESNEGLPAIEPFLIPVTREEEEATGVRIATQLPEKAQKIVRSAFAAKTPGALVQAGLVPSAEALAELAPQITAPEIGRTCLDADLGVLLSRTYKAFSQRRSLLLFNLESQVRFHELPWVQATLPARDASAKNGLLTAAHKLIACAVDSFPGVVLPNVLVRELNVLYDEAGQGRPFVPELAADIFMGQFAPVFDAAVRIAGKLLQGSLYERYFGLDYADFLTHANSRPPKARGESTLAWAVAAHRERDTMRKGSGVAENGVRIERAQLYTTHNLAALEHFGIKPDNSYTALSLQALQHSFKILQRIQRHPEVYGALAAVKNAAYAWRQALFFLSVSLRKEDQDNFNGFLSELYTLARRFQLRETLVRQLADGLKHIMKEGEFDGSGRTGSSGRRFLGWTTERHWVLDCMSGA